MRSSKKIFTPVVILALLGLAGVLITSQKIYADQWQSQSANSHLYFAPSWEGLPINGAFKQFAVTLNRDENDQPKSLSVSVQISSADMGTADFNEAIQMAEWFNGSTFAEAVFTSNTIALAESTDQSTQFIALGTLQLKGVKRNIEFPFSWSEPLDGNALMAGELTLGRNDFAIGTGEWAGGDQIGLAVKVWFDLVLESAND